MMTWRKWWALEIVSGLGILVVTLPLGYVRFLINAGLVTAFAVFYLKRVQGQKARGAGCGVGSRAAG